MTVQIIERGIVLVEVTLRDDDPKTLISLPNGPIAYSYIEEAIKVFTTQRLNSLWEEERRSL